LLIHPFVQPMRRRGRASRFRRNGGEVDWFWLAGARCLEEARRELLEPTFLESSLGNSALASEA